MRLCQVSREGVGEVNLPLGRLNGPCQSVREADHLIEVEIGMEVLLINPISFDSVLSQVS